MRPLLLPGLLDAARRNAAHGRPAVGLFESAHVYEPADGEAPARERHHVCALLTGETPGSWRGEPTAADYYAIRGVLDGVLDGVGVGWRSEQETGAAADRPFLDPGRSAAVVADGRPIGWLGEVHPVVAGEWDLDRCAAFELDADALADLVPSTIAFHAVPAFPPVVQDFAVVVAEDAAAAEVADAVRAETGELLESLRLFDVYRGEQVGAGSKSLAMRLELRAPDRTLTDSETQDVRARIETRLAAIGGRLRD